MSYVVDNAVIMAAGLSSRFAPLSHEKPKALINVRGEILVERQIRQLRNAGVADILLVVGYKKEMFYYLKEKFGIHILENTEYAVRNNNSSLYVARKYLKNTYICSADNYFTVNPFEQEVEESYYSALYADGPTKEWCLECDEDDWITNVKIGGKDSWYMMGHVFFSEKFSEKFVEILCREYEWEKTKDKLWENIYIDHIQELPMKIRKYQTNDIYEFDSLDELRLFDMKYLKNSGSQTMKELAGRLNCGEEELICLKPLKDCTGQVEGVSFIYDSEKYEYIYKTGILTQR